MAWQLSSEGGGPAAPRPTDASGPNPLDRSLQALQRRAHRGVTLERVHTEVEEALSHQEFRLQYQPRISTADRDTTGVEALLRWSDAGRGELGPKAFLPSVRQTAAMIPLGRWVVEEACRQLATWERARPASARPLLMSVNVTGLEVLEDGFSDHLLRTAEAHDLPLAQLQIELDAADELRGDTALGLRLQGLRHRGLRVAIDNVGPAFGLAGNRIGADAVHIDRRWVRSIVDDAEVRSSLAALVTRAHDSGARALASGVQTAAELEALGEIGCDEVQGYLFCPPVDANELDWIDDD